MALAVAAPGQGNRLVIRRNVAVGGRSDFMAIFDPVERCASCGDHMRFKIHGVSLCCLQEVARVNGLAGRLRGHVEDAVTGSRNIDEDVAGADTVEDCRRGEVLAVDDSGGAADRANLIERLHGTVIVAAADAGETAAAIQLPVPEGKFGNSVSFVAAIDGFNAGE